MTGSLADSCLMARLASHAKDPFHQYADLVLRI